MAGSSIDLRKIGEGPIGSVPSVSGAIVISMQGEDHYLEPADDRAVHAIASRHRD